MLHDLFTSVVVVVVLLTLDVQLFLELSTQQVQPLVCGLILSFGSPPVQVLQHSQTDLLHPGGHTDTQRDSVRMRAVSVLVVSNRDSTF